MADTALLKKLLVKPNHRLLILNAPEGYLARLQPLPEGATLTEAPDGSVFDMVHLFARDTTQLAQHTPTAIGALKPEGILWLSYPKQSAKVKTDITRDRGWEVVRAAGLEGVTQIAIDDTWSALRFKPQRPTFTPTPQQFQVVLHPYEGSEATGIVLPFSVEQAFGTRARVPVKGTLNGTPFHSSAFPQGDGTHYMVINKELRAAAGVQVGDTLDIVMERDNEPRELEPPADLWAALQTNPAAMTMWEQLSYSHRKEHITAIEAAKKPETRTRRLEKAIAALAAGQKPR